MRSNSCAGLGLGFVLGLSLCAAAPAARADAFPTRPVVLVAPYAAGSGNDIVARALGNGLSQVLKQPVVIENRDGAAGVVGMNYVAHTRPDGYTVVLAGIGTVVMRPALEGDRNSFNAEKELAPVSLIAKGSPVVVVNAELGVKTLPELIALARKDRVTYGSPGVGTAMHLVGELMQNLTGAPLIHVPYRGQGLAMADVLAGTISFAFTDVSVALPFAADRRVRIIAVAGKERAPQFPDVPTTAELGYPDLVMENWYALYAPRDTPAPVVARLSEAAQQAMALPSVRQIIDRTTGLIPLGTDAAALLRQTEADNAKWQPLAARLRQ